MRCKACEAVMRPEEIIWKDDQHCFEELCRYCRYEVQRSLSSSMLDADNGRLHYIEEEYQYTSEGEPYYLEDYDKD